MAPLLLVGLNKIFAGGALNLNDTRDGVSSCLELILGIQLAIRSIYLDIYVFFRHNNRTDLIRTIKNGNIAFACVVSGTILAASLMIHYGVIGIVTTLP
ncbi:MAG: hypothetical protein WCF90_10390 [Methanomicrobiales archaeon]